MVSLSISHNGPCSTPELPKSADSTEGGLMEVTGLLQQSAICLPCCQRGGSLPSLYCCLQNPPPPLWSLITFTSVPWHCARPLLPGLHFSFWSHEGWFPFCCHISYFPSLHLCLFWILKLTLTQLLASISHRLSFSHGSCQLVMVHWKRDSWLLS